MYKLQNIILLRLVFRDKLDYYVINMLQEKVKFALFLQNFHPLGRISHWRSQIL